MSKPSAGERIRRLRARRGITLSALAAAAKEQSGINFTKVKVWRFEHGVQEPRVVEFEALLAVLEPKRAAA